MDQNAPWLPATAHAAGEPERGDSCERSAGRRVSIRPVAACGKEKTYNDRESIAEDHLVCVPERIREIDMRTEPAG